MQSKRYKTLGQRQKQPQHDPRVVLYRRAQIPNLQQYPEGSKYLIIINNHILSKILTYITTILKPST